MTYLSPTPDHAVTEINVSLQISVSGPDAEKLRRLVSEIGQEPDILAGQNARLAVALVLYAAEIQQVSLSPPLEKEVGSEQSSQSAKLHHWTLDRSSPSTACWDDGTVIEVPPRREGAWG